MTIFRGLIYWNLGQWSCWHVRLIMPNPFWIFMLVHEFWVICIKYIIYFYILLASFWASQVRKRVVIFSDSSSKLNLLPFRKLTIILYNENNHIGPPNRCQSYAHHPKCGISHKITQLKIGLNSNEIFEKYDTSQNIEKISSFKLFKSHYLCHFWVHMVI